MDPKCDNLAEKSGPDKMIRPGSGQEEKACVIDLAFSFLFIYALSFSYEFQVGFAQTAVLAGFNTEPWETWQ